MDSVYEPIFSAGSQSSVAVLVQLQPVFPLRDKRGYRRRMAGSARFPRGRAREPLAFGFLFGDAPPPVDAEKSPNPGASTSPEVRQGESVEVTGFSVHVAES